MIEKQKKAQSQKTALLVALTLGALAAWNVHRGRVVLAETMGGIAATLAIVGLCLPAVAFQFHRAWMTVGGALGYVNSRILLSVIYYLLITPLGCFRKMMGRDPLRRRQPRSDSYWIPRTTLRQSKEQFERAF